MRRARKAGFLQGLSSGPKMRGLLAIVLLFLFGFQVSRFYLVAQLDPTLCRELEHGHSSSVATDHHHEDAEPIPSSHDSGFFFQHCKDTYNSISLTPAQPFAPPASVADAQSEPSRVVPLPENNSLAENFLPPPFQPPRIQS